MFANSLLNGVHTIDDNSAYHVLKAQKRLVQFNVDSNGDVVSSGNSDAVLRDRSVRVKTKLACLLDSRATQGVVSLSEEYGQNGEVVKYGEASKAHLLAAALMTAEQEEVPTSALT